MNTLEITSQTETVGVNFHPLTEGDFSTNLTITDSEGTETIIPLTGTGYDAMISDFPHFEGFEGYNTGTLPPDWSVVVNSTSTYAVGDVTATSFEGDRGFRLYNSADANAAITAITPPINELSTRRIRFMGRSSTAGAGLIIGTATNNSGEINFTARDTVYFTTTYEQFQHGFVGSPEDDQFIALQFVGTGATYLSVYLDNFFIESIPNGPAIVVTQDTLDFGNVYLNRIGLAQLNVQNWGILPLEVEFSQEGTELSFTPNEVTIQPNATQNITVNLEPSAEGDYSGSFEVLSNDPAIPTITVNTTAFILPPLPDNISILLEMGY